MPKKTLLSILFIAAIVIGLFLFNRVHQPPGLPEHQNQQESGKNRSTPPSDHPNRREEFDRRTTSIIYTKHAQCRMGCRHIDEIEVREILERGTINYEKSDPSGKPDPKYALEGVTRDGQEVRIVFAPADRGMVVITVIDLQKEWNCNCK